MKTTKHLIRFPGDAFFRSIQVQLVTGVLLLTLLSFRQNLFAESFHSIHNPAPGSDWVLDTTVSNVDFYHMIGECNGKKVVFLKFNNRNSNKVKVTWKEVFSTQFENRREGFKGEKQLVLSNGETSQRDCTSINIKECVVLPSEVSSTYLADILNFTFSHVRVSNAL